MLRITGHSESGRVAFPFDLIGGAMNILDIIGPVMVGPSSSHTAGAVRIGLVAGKLLAEPIKEAQIHLHGSFWATGSGHGTDRAIVAGLLGLAVDDARIPYSFELADEAGMKFSFDHVELVDAHPNTVKLNLTGVNGSVLEVVAASIGGGRIRVCEIDGLPANFEGDYPTLRQCLVTRVSISLRFSCFVRAEEDRLRWSLSVIRRFRQSQSSGCPDRKELSKSHI